MLAFYSLIKPFYKCGANTKIKNYTEDIDFNDFIEIDLADKN